MHAHKLHGFAAVLVVGMMNAVGHAVELQGCDAVKPTQRFIEHRRSLDPSAVQMDRGEAVEVENVSTDEPFQPLRGEMIPDIGQHQNAGNPDGPNSGGVQDRFMHTKPSAPLSDRARAQSLPRQVRTVDVVEDAVAHSVVNLDRLVRGGHRVRRKSTTDELADLR